MTTDPYIGSAGGQPRLLIPTIDRIQDPAVTIAMNAILRWGNSLLLGTGSPPVLAWQHCLKPTFSAGGIFLEQVTEWSVVAGDPDYNYFEGDGTNTYIEQLPADGISFFSYGAIAQEPLDSPLNVTMALNDGYGYPGFAPGVSTSLAGPSESATVTGTFIVDDDDIPDGITLPWSWYCNGQNFKNVSLWFNILTLSKA
jgi:hypothetical protein